MIAILNCDLSRDDYVHLTEMDIQHIEDAKLGHHNVACVILRGP